MNTPGATDKKKTHQPIGTYVVTGIGLLADIIALLTFFGVIRVREGDEVDLQRLSVAFVTTVAIAIIYSLGLLVSGLSRRWKVHRLSRIVQPEFKYGWENDYEVERQVAKVNEQSVYVRIVLGIIFCMPIFLFLFTFSVPLGSGEVTFVTLIFGLVFGAMAGVALAAISFLFDFVLDLVATF